MEKVDDKTLTAFLIHCMSGIFEGDINPLEKPVIPAKNVQQFRARQGSLLYLETTAGNIYRTQTDIRVFNEHTDEREQIWCMQIFAHSNPKALSDAALGAYDVRMFLMETRLAAFERTLKNIEAGDRYCLLDIAARQEPVHEKIGGHERGRLVYRESIEDNLDCFVGTEVVEFRTNDTGRVRSVLFEARYQGGRL